MHLKHLLLAFTIVGLVPAATATADPISIVSGTMVTSPTDSFAHFSLIGDGNNRIDGRWPGLSLACQPCVAGGMASPNALFIYDTVPFVLGDPFASGSATIDGVAYPSLFFSGTLTATGDSFVLPDIVGPAERVITFAQPFSFTGTISGFDRLQAGPNDVFPVFTSTWIGSGTADVRFLGTPLDGVSHYSYLGTTYDFAAPTPEPGALWLCATGVAALLTRRRLTTR